MTTFIKAKPKKSDQQTLIDKYRVTVHKKKYRKAYHSKNFK